MSTAAAAPKAGARAQPARTFYERIADILPTWAWVVFWSVIGIGYGAIGQDVFGEGLFDAMITTLAFVIMALGLNIVVGFAGLLDLGYVAFYAIGAFVGGWFMSSFFGDANVHIVVSDISQRLPGIHINFILVLVMVFRPQGLFGEETREG